MNNLINLEVRQKNFVKKLMDVEKTIAILGNDPKNDVENAKICRANYLADREKYGDKQNGTYKEVEWEATRHPGLGFWRGYVLCDIPEEKIKILEEIAHGGLTATYGFDCGHWGDYSAGDRVYKETVYRDFPYVLSVIHKMIDAL